MQPSEPIPWHALQTGEVEAKLAVDESTGLSTVEVKLRQQKYGRNEMTAKAGAPAWLRFIRQFHQAFIYILLGAAAGCFFLKEFVDASVILGVVLVNAAVGYIQEARGPSRPSAP